MQKQRGSRHRVSLATDVSESALSEDDEGSEEMEEGEESEEDHGEHAPVRVKRWHGGEDLVTHPRWPTDAEPVTVSYPHPWYGKGSNTGSGSHASTASRHRVPQPQRRAHA